MCRAVKGSVSVISPPASGNVPLVALPVDGGAVEAADLDVAAVEVRLELGRVGRNDGDAAGRQRGDRLGVRLGDALDGADELEVLRADRRDEATCGRAIAQSSAIWPSPRMPISVTRISVSGSSRQTVSGRPISLFWLASAQIVGTTALQRAPRMSFVEVLPVEPTTATTRASLFERTRRGERGERRLLVVAARAWRLRARQPRRRGRRRVERDEEVAGPDDAGVGLDAGDLRRPRRAVLERAETERNDLVPNERDHARRTPPRAAPRARRRGRRTARRRPPSPGPARAPSPRSRRRPRRRRATRPGIALPRSGSISTSIPAPCSTSWMIASGSSLRGLSDVTMT